MGIQIHQPELMQHAVGEARCRGRIGLDRDGDGPSESGRHIVGPGAGGGPVSGEVDVVGDDDHALEVVEQVWLRGHQLGYHLLGQFDEQVAIRVIVVVFVVVERQRPAEGGHQAGLPVTHLGDVVAHVRHQVLQVGQRRLEGHVGELDAHHQGVLHTGGDGRFGQVAADGHGIALAGVAHVDLRADDPDRPVAGRRACLPAPSPRC